MNCPHCGQTIKAPKPSKPQLAESTDTATMSDAQLFAYYKRTAPLADLRFWLNNAVMSESLRAVDYARLEPEEPKAKAS